MEMSEHQLQQLIKNYLEATGWFVLRQNSGMVKSEGGGMVRLGTVGTPDLMAFKRVKSEASETAFESKKLSLLFIEVKTPKNPKPTPAQENMMKLLEESGAECIVAHSLEEVQEYLKGGGK